MTETCKPNALFYDGDCPFCTRYSELMQARKNLGGFALINLRDNPDHALEFKDMGFDLEEGFIFRYNGKIYHGSDAIQKLATNNQQSDIFSKINQILFSNTTRSKAIYPILKMGRNLTLFILKGSNRTKL